MVTKKTRGNVVSECAKAVVACWNHYADVELSELELAIVRDTMRDILPKQISTREWSAAAVAYEKNLKSVGK